MKAILLLSKKSLFDKYNLTKDTFATWYCLISYLRKKEKILKKEYLT